MFLTKSQMIARTANRALKATAMIILTSVSILTFMYMLVTF